MDSLALRSSPTSPVIRVKVDAMEHRRELGPKDVVGACFAVEPDPVKAASLMIEHIDSQRRKLGLA